LLQRNSGFIASTIGIDGAAIRDLMLKSIEYRFGKINLPTTIQWLCDNVLNNFDTPPVISSTARDL
jgi:hypothetical protein